MPASPTPTAEILSKLTSQQNLWIATVRPDGRPHLAPIWFVWHNDKIYLGTDPKSVKARNLRANERVSCALEDGAHPVICEGIAQHVPAPWAEDVLAAFFQKYEWDLNKEAQYNDVWAITPEKWMAW